MPNPRTLIISNDKRECRELTNLAETMRFYTFASSSIEHFRKRVHEFKPDLIFINRQVINTNLLDFLLQLPGRRKVLLGLITDDSQTLELVKQTDASQIHLLDRPIDHQAITRLLRRVSQSERIRKRRLRQPRRFELMVGSSQPMQQVYSQIAKAAPTDATILICGQSGTGKELVARSIHNRSERRDKNFVAINCGALPESLIESELFGCEKGAYTGAEKMRKGVFERAQNGTLFLDEITEMGMEAQTRLLRVLEERAVTRIGGDKSIKLNVRVIAATNRDPLQAIEEGQLREDLHYRLAVFPLQIPSLAERGDDIVLLANHFLAEHNKAQGTEKKLTELGIERLREYDWPGNVRQLRNMVYRDFIIEDHHLDMSSLVQYINENGHTQSVTDTPADQAIQATALDEPQQPAENPPLVDSPTQPEFNEVDATDESPETLPHITIPIGTTLDDANKALILKTLEHCEDNRTQAAQQLGISVKTLYNRLQKYEQNE
ncbi:MAG: sigma-54 interaction domain-containing protein [Phycisphaeraceae bacterium JB051]